MRRFVVLILVAGLALAASDAARGEGVLSENPQDVFDTPEQLLRYERMINDLRCVVCQNQSVAESQVDLARDLRQITRDMILAGSTDDEIKQYMVDRYGDFVLYDPPLNALTFLLWGAPVILLLVGAGVMVSVVGRRSGHAGDEAAGMGENT